ncbi:MAG TPA: hypothetical protein VFS21_00455 [Roseiflexaceae bacterium]|nr:hypothetical protein [Roseiflexaceae bacterium]
MTGALEPGQVVEVEVVAVAVFGFFGRHGAQGLLVRLPEVSWIASFGSCALFTDVGERHTVRVLHVDAASGRVSASIRRLHPDPWPADTIAAGRVYRARVLRRVAHADRCGGAPAHLVELVPGGFAMLCDTGHPLAPGEICPVLVRSADPRRRAVELALVEESR